MAAGCATNCDEGGRWPEADPKEQAVLISAGLLYVASGARAVLRNRPRWFPLWLAGLLFWAVVPKYFICTRCENYGKSCDFFYGGRYAARLFPKSDKPFNSSGYFTEGIPLAVVEFLPVIAARRDFSSLISYLLSAGLFQAALVKICCLDCVKYSTDPWKADYCPTYKIVEKAGLAAKEL